MSKLKGLLSTIGLVGLLAFDAILIAICFICHQFFWAFAFITITSTIGIFEGLSYCITGKTISQHWWVWSQENPKMMWWSLGGLVAFSLAMASLVLHLAAPILAKLFGG